MAIQLRWLGHGCWWMDIAGTTLLLDPFLNDSPTAPVKSTDVSAQYVLVSHGHFDHVSDAAEVTNRCGATLVAIYEVAEWFAQNHQVEKVEHMNIGGSITLPFGRVQLTHAIHSSQLPDGSYGGNPGGFLIESEGQRIYFACDTALFSDMQLIGDLGIDCAVLPIGDRFTMGPADSVKATQLIRPKLVLPAHYNTWPPIEQDAEAWSHQIREQTSAEPRVLQPGETISL